MLTFATDFWPLFWTVLGSAAALAILCSVMIATMGSQPQPVPVEHTTYLTEFAAAEREHQRQAA